MIKEPPAKAKTQVQPTPQALAVPRLESRLPWLVGLAVSLFSLLVYLVTLSPTVNFIDSGELITVAATGGIAHPPGYPLYTLLTILGAALSFGNVAVGVNAVSAFAGALAVGLFYVLVYELVRHHFQLPWFTTPANVPGRGGRKAERANGKAPKPVAAPPTPKIDWAAVSVAAGAALLLGACVAFWNWSTEAKYYSLHYVFISLLFLLALRARRHVYGAGQPGQLWPPSHWPAPARTLMLLAAGTGLAFTNQPMSVLLLPAIAVLLLWPQPLSAQVRGRTVEPDALLWRWLLKYLLWLLVAGLLPLVLYLYLPLRSSQQPLLNWGSPDNPGDFWRHVTLWQFSVFLGKPQGTPIEFLGQTINRASNQLGPLLGVVVLGFAVAGVVRMTRTAQAFLAASALLVLLMLYQTYGFQSAEIAAYSVPMYMMFIAWAGVGLYWLVTAIGERMVPQQAGRQSGTQARRSEWAAAIPLALALVALAWNFGRAGHAGNYLTDSYLHNQFKNFAQNAVVFTNNWYLVSPSYYLQNVQKERPDVAIIDRKLLQYPFYLDYARRQYPQVMDTVKEISGPFGDLERRWVNGEQVDSQQISTLYFNMMKQLISSNLAAGRPVYVQWDDPGAEENYIMQGFPTHPEGLALRVDTQPFTGAPADPQFDWRGILTDPVPKEDLAMLVIDEYPAALDRLAQFAQQNGHATEAANFASQAAQVRAALGLPGK
jgi:hypothetical protein